MINIEKTKQEIIKEYVGIRSAFKKSYKNSNMNQGRRIRVAQIVRSAQYGGVENHVLYIISKMDRNKYDPTLICLTKESANSQFMQQGIEIHNLNDSEASSYKSIKTLIPLFKILIKIKPDIVHLHGIRPIFLGSIAARISGVKIVVSTLHGAHYEMSIDNNGDTNTMLLLFSKLMHAIGLCLSDFIITISNFGREDIKSIFSIFPVSCNFFKAKSIETIYNGIETETIRPSPKQLFRDKLKVNYNSVVFGTISRLDEPKKGISIFLKAAKIILEKGFSASFIITGKGYSETKLKRLAQALGIHPHVHFVGYVENLNDILGTLDVFVLPSLTEGFGIVNLEAMAAELPIIATSVGGVPEAILQGYNGILVPPRNEVQLASAMEFLCVNPEIRKKMGINGKKRVESDFHLKFMTQRIFSIYEKAASMQPAD